jgi:class 3 adenylate cyclase/tetratricopeptide (TPR) repeat protein
LSPQTILALRRSERKVVTILFADIKGSLALVAGQDPELAGEILNAVVACMGDAVRRHGGLVNQVMGDGIMALFGAPIAIEDHAAQACLAALAMRVAIQVQVRPRVSLRVGLSTGEVVVRAVPGDVGLHYSAAGEAVHLASRMEQSAAVDQILLTDSTRLLAGQVIETALRPDFVVKGLDAPMPVFELLGTRPGTSLARDATLSGPVSGRSHAMVGRDRELEQLRKARDRAAAGEGQALRLIGEAGTGKSRLLHEFAGQHLAGEWRVFQSGAVPHRRASYGVVTDLLAGLFGLDQDDAPAVRRDKVAATLDVAASDREAAMAPLSALLNLQAHAPGWVALDAWERRERTIAATVQAFQRLAMEHPVGVVVEDAHWLDAESATCIQRLGATAAGRRLLAVVTQRAASHGQDVPEDHSAWREARWTDCPIRPLDEAATVAFLRGRLLPGHDVETLERKLIEHTSGNPLFLEECLQALVDTGELVRVGERVRLDHPVSVLRVPSSLRGLLDARVDRLGDAEKDVLQAAAVVGSTVPMDLLASATGLDEIALQGTLSQLMDAGFLVERDRPRTRVAFRHGLIREAAYNTILRRTRVRMHGAVLDALERRPGPPDPIVDLLADHAIHAEAWPKAAAYAQRAAVRAYDRYANPEAVQYYDRALLAAKALPAGPSRDETLLKLHIGVRWPLFRLGRVAALGPHLDEAVRLAAAKPGHEELAQAHVMRSHVHWLRGDPDGARADAAAAAALAVAHDDEELAVRACFQRGLVGLSQSDVPGTLADMGAVIAHLRPRPAPGRYGLDDRLLVNAHSYAARAHAAAGDLVAARIACDEALALSDRIEERQTRIYAQLADSIVSLAEGRADRAVRAAAEADELCRGADVRLLSPVAAGCLAQAHMAAGAAAVAVPIARQAVDDAARMGFMALQPQRLLILAEALMVLDRVPEAEQQARAALELARTVGEAGSEAGAFGLLAAALMRQGREGEGMEAARAGRVIALRLGLTPLLLGLDARAAGLDRNAAAN